MSGSQPTPGGPGDSTSASWMSSGVDIVRGIACPRTGGEVALSVLADLGVVYGFARVAGRILGRHRLPTAFNSWSRTLVPAGLAAAVHQTAAYLLREDSLPPAAADAAVLQQQVHDLTRDLGAANTRADAAEQQRDAARADADRYKADRDAAQDGAKSFITYTKQALTEARVGDDVVGDLANQAAELEGADYMKRTKAAGDDGGPLAKESAARRTFFQWCRDQWNGERAEPPTATEAAAAAVAAGDGSAAAAAIAADGDGDDT